MSHSDLHLHLDAYLGVRQTLGFQMRAERTLLREFVRYIETHADAGPIRAYLAVDWACASSTQRGASGAAQRLSMARGFLTYLRAILPETEVPNSGLVRAFRRPKPYLLTAPQITALIRAAQDLGPRGSLRPHTFATFIGVLASTGLRVGEAIRLTVQDVHLDATPPVLHIRETKFHKSRLVPLHPTTVVPLRRYSAVRTTLHYAALSDVFFVSEQGQALTHDALARWFAQLCRQLGLEPTAGGRRPSLHALRHAFAMERLRRWHQDGMDVQALLPHLDGVATAPGDERRRGVLAQPRLPARVECEVGMVVEGQVDLDLLAARKPTGAPKSKTYITNRSRPSRAQKPSMTSASRSKVQANGPPTEAAAGASLCPKPG